MRLKGLTKNENNNSLDMAEPALRRNHYWKIKVLTTIKPGLQVLPARQVTCKYIGHFGDKIFR
jgi:hypothetical protein